MHVAPALVLVSTDPDAGKSRLPSMQSDAAVGGALLVDLILQGRVELDGSGRKGRVVVSDPTPVDDSALQEAFGRLQGRRPLRPQDAVNRLGKNSKAAVYDTLHARGLIAVHVDKVAGLFPVRRYEVLATGERDRLLADVRRVLLAGADADATTGPLVGLLLAADLVKLVVDRPDRKRAKARARVVAEGDWASAGVRDAIKASQAAIAAVAVTVSAAGATGAGS